jgi:hypothetical protein
MISGATEQVRWPSTGENGFGQASYIPNDVAFRQQLVWVSTSRPATDPGSGGFECERARARWVVPSHSSGGGIPYTPIISSGGDIYRPAWGSGWGIRQSGTRSDGPASVARERNSFLHLDPPSRGSRDMLRDRAEPFVAKSTISTPFLRIPP